MADFDELVPNYRRAKDRWPDAPTLAKYYEAITACHAGNDHGLVEHVKSFIECVCVTILGEFGQPMPSSTPTTTELLVAALQPLGLQNSRGASKLDKVLSGFNKLSDALSDMRNEHGPVAHGKDGFLDAVTQDHSRAFLHTGDAILGVILNALDGKEPDLLTTREPYERFFHLCDRIDRAVAVKAAVDMDGDRSFLVFTVTSGGPEQQIELRVEPSRLLYGIDRSAFIEVLNNISVMPGEVEDTEETTPSPPPEVLVSAAERAPVTELVKKYEGRLIGLRPAIEGFLHAEKLDELKSQPDGSDLPDSLLATADQNMGVDWQKREALQARLRVACRRVLVGFGCEPHKAEEISGRLVSWFQIQCPDLGDVQTGAS